MTRSLKGLGLALVAVLALGAVMASAASATPRLTPTNEADYPVTLKGEQTGLKPHQFTLPGSRNFKCTTVKFSGTIANKAAAETSEVTVSPTYENCTAEILGNVDPVTVTFNSCDYVLKAEAETSGTIKTEGWEVTGSAEVKCNTAGDKIEVHVWPKGTLPAEHPTKTPLCTYNIFPQTIKSLDYKLENGGTEGTIRATGKEIAVKRASGTLTNCGAESQLAEYTGDAKVEGFNGSGTMITGKWDLP